MKIEKELEKIGISPLSKITPIEKKVLVENVVTCLVNAFSKLNINYNQLSMKLYTCNMYRARVEEGFNKVNYFYKNKSIYFDENIEIEKIDVNILHECIHYIQDNRDFEGALEQIGLCEFTEYKVHGFELNEASVQYLAHRALNIEVPNNYLNKLIEQIIFCVGENVFIESTIYGNGNFKEKFMYIFADDVIYTKLENTFEYIASRTKQISELNNKKENLKEYKYSTKIQKLTKEITHSFEKMQQNLFEQYFNVLIQYINQLEEIEECRKKLDLYKQLIICSEEERKNYENFVTEENKKLDKKMIEIYRKNSANSLVKLSNNPIILLLRNIKKVLFKNEI